MIYIIWLTLSKYERSSRKLAIDDMPSKISRFIAMPDFEQIIIQALRSSKESFSRQLFKKKKEFVHALTFWAGCGRGGISKIVCV